MLQDLPDDGGFGDEGQDPHLSPAGAKQGVGFIDPADELGPLPPPPFPLGSRRFVIRLDGVGRVHTLGRLALGLCVARGLAAPCSRDVGVVPVVSQEVEPGRGNVHHQAGEELRRVEGLAAALSRSLVAVAGKPRLEGETLERQRRSQQVAGEPLETGGILGPNGDRIVGREFRVSLRARLIKTGTRLVRHGRYAIFQMAEVTIPRDVFAAILNMINTLRGPPSGATCA